MGFKMNFDLDKFRQEFLQSDGWKVSDCYKSYDDKFLRKDAQDAYEGAKWAWQEQQKRIDELQARVDDALQKIKGASRWIYEDAIDDPEFIKGGALRALKHLEQALKGKEND